MKNSTHWVIAILTLAAAASHFSPVANADYDIDCGYRGCCSEKVDGNVKSVEKRMKALAESPEFVDAKLFRGSVAKVASRKGTQAKLEATLEILDLRKDELLSLVGARDEEQAQYIERVRSKLDLDESQAKAVFGAVHDELFRNIAK